jgi:hypothetical protein
MQEMVVYLEKQGFNVRKRYISQRTSYEFSIKKDNVFFVGCFEYPERADNREKQLKQEYFLDSLIAGWETQYRIVNGETNIFKKEPQYIPPTIKKVIFNPPATVVLWEDGTKTVVKAQDEDFDPEKGLAMAISKKALGNQGNYCNEIKKWTDQYYAEQSMIESFYKWMRDHIYPKKPNPTQQAYDILVKTINKKGVLKSELGTAIKEAIGYLSEALDN